VPPPPVGGGPVGLAGALVFEVGAGDPVELELAGCGEELPVGVPLVALPVAALPVAELPAAALVAVPVEVAVAVRG
jgi:hypothetical protein